MSALSSQLRGQRGALLVKVLFGLVLAGALGCVLWVVILPGWVVSTIRTRTGFGASVEHLSVNPFTAKVTITGLVLKNPAGWPQEEFVSLREFRAEGDLFSLLGNRLVADEVVVDVAQVTIVRNQHGDLNAAVFKAGMNREDKTGAVGPKIAGPQRAFLIKHLVLRFDRMVFADYSSGQLRLKEYNLNISRDMRDVDSVAKIVSPFTGSALGMVTGLLGGRFPTGGDFLNDLKGGLQDAGKKTGEKLKGLLDSLDKMKP